MLLFEQSLLQYAVFSSRQIVGPPGTQVVNIVSLGARVIGDQ